MLDNINWYLFTNEEKKYIKQMYQRGDISALTAVIEEMTPEKEIELQKIHDILKPITDDYTSKVRDKYFKDNPDGPQTPEQEAELQSEMNNEFAEYKDKLKEKNKKKIDKLEKKDKKEDEKEQKETEKKLVDKEKEDAKIKKEQEAKETEKKKVK